MARLLSFPIAALLWLLALVDAQDILEGDSALPPAEVLGNGFSPTSPLLARGMLNTRQIYKCADAGFYPCDHHRGCCQSGWGCCPTECCPAGTNCCRGGGCVYPGGECCGDGTSCRPGTTCYRLAGTWRCRKPCPEVTTDTTTITRTRESTTTTTTKTVPPGGESPGFSCPPMTVTNFLGDSLELGSDCALKYSPAKSTTASEAVAALRIRQDDCPPTRITSTVYTTEGTGGSATVTATVTGDDSAPPSFSCAPMAVTNAAGDELSLDDKCAIQLTIADPKDISKPGTAGRADIFIATRYAVLLTIVTLLVGL